MGLEQKIWNQDQLQKMNEEAFLVEMLDMLQISPVTAEDDSDIQRMKVKLDNVEAMIEGRLNT
jgi:hypothetical protein